MLLSVAVPMPGGFGNRYRRSSIKLCTTTPSTLHDGDGGDGYGDDTMLLNVPYNKLPQQEFMLSVLKLDGSLFDVHVRRNATVADLKQAVEEVFITSSNEDQEEISWSHVWEHFCLSYDGQKLINDKACIKNFGIKDGDQLQFIKHLSINHKLSKKQLKSFNAANKRGLSGSNSHEEKERSFIDDDFEVDEAIKRSQLLNRWLSYPKYHGGLRELAGRRSRSSRFGLQSLIGRRIRMMSLTN